MRNSWCLSVHKRALMETSVISLRKALFLLQLLMEVFSRKENTLFNLSLKKNNSTNQLKIEKAAQQGQFQLGIL